MQVRRLLCCDCRDRDFEIIHYTCTGQWIRRWCKIFKRSKHCYEALRVSLWWWDWLGCRLNASCTSIFEISRREGPILMPVNQKTMPAVQTVQTLTRSSTINSQKVLDLFFLDMRFLIREMVFEMGFIQWVFRDSVPPCTFLAEMQRRCSSIFATVVVSVLRARPFNIRWGYVYLVN